LSRRWASRASATSAVSKNVTPRSTADRSSEDHLLLVCRRTVGRARRPRLPGYCFQVCASAFMSPSRCHVRLTRDGLESWYGLDTVSPERRGLFCPHGLARFEERPSRIQDRAS
jgi:hypothetical protein